jgi:aminoglycoside phosphotransferase (APT) family kinase protein
VWRCGDLAFRFPRRTFGIAAVETEMRVLPRLAPRVGVAVPVPLRVGRASAAFPAPFYAHRYLEGRTADRAALDDAGRARLAPALAAFLRELHRIEGLPVEADTFRADAARSAERARPRLPILEASAWASYLPAARACLDDVPPPADAPPVLLHGDLYARHLLLDDAGDLTGVLDWGDVCLGDRALDLSVVYSFLPPAAHAAFWSAYGETSETTRRRAHFLALTRYGINLLAYALDVGDTALEREAGGALARLAGGGPRPG